MAGYILLVDDNPTNLKLLISMLAEYGYKTRPATSGQRALAMVAKEQPDLILLDINMPEMDGFEVCQRLKSQPQIADIPVIFISASDEVFDKVQAFQLGGVDYVTKPFEPLELYARVKAHLDLKHFRDQLQASNQQLSEANAGLQSLNAIKDDFLGMVSHDLKNPLSSILLFSRFMESRNLNEEKTKEIGTLITQAGQRMLKLIEDLLEVNKLEQGKVQLWPENVDLNFYLSYITNDMTAQAADKNQEVLCLLPADAVFLNIDPMRLRQVLENLLSNALKFSPPGAQIKLILEQNNQEIRIQVQDQGPGFTPADQEKLFTKFGRLSAQPTGREHSTGLGLFISRQLVLAMNGHITCENGNKQGACVTLCFPILAE